MHVQVLKEVGHSPPAVGCEEGHIGLCASLVVCQLHAQGRLRQQDHIEAAQELCVWLLRDTLWQRLYPHQGVHLPQGCSTGFGDTAARTLVMSAMLFLDRGTEACVGSEQSTPTNKGLKHTGCEVRPLKDTFGMPYSLLV